MVVLKQIDCGYDTWIGTLGTAFKVDEVVHNKKGTTPHLYSEFDASQNTSEVLFSQPGYSLLELRSAFLLWYIIYPMYE